MNFANHTWGLGGRFLLTLLFCSVCSFCTDELPGIVWEGEKIRFATTYDYLPCGRTLQNLDAAVFKIESDAGYQIPDGEKITYYWLREQDSDLTPCGPVSSCTDGKNTVFSISPFHYHELIHATLSYQGRTNVVLEEGAAIALDRWPILISSTQTYNFPDADAVASVVGWLKNPPDDRHDVNYIVVGHYMRFMLDNYGTDAVNALYSGIGMNSSYQEIEKVYSTVLGKGVSQTLDEWVDEAPWCYNGTFDCNDNVIDDEAGPDGPFWELRVELNCDSETVSEQYYTFTLYHRSIIIIKEEGIYLSDVNVSPESDARVFLINCIDCSEYLNWIELTLGEQEELALEETSYILLVEESGEMNNINSWVEVHLSAV